MVTLTHIVIPTNVGIQVGAKEYGTASLDSRLHGNDMRSDVGMTDERRRRVFPK